MRKSVERRLRQQQQRTPKPKQPGFFRRRLVSVIAIPVLMIAAAGVNVYLYHGEQVAATARGAQQAKLLAAIDTATQKAIQKKYDDARKAEEEAKKKAEEEEAARKAAAAQPAGTAATRVNCATANPESITVVINKKHCFSPISWAPGDLTSVNGYLLRAEAASQMINMMSAAAAAGAGFDISSSYRSYSDQVYVYNNWVAVNGSQAAADTVSARPGYSEHQTGLVADLKVGSCSLACFAGQPAYPWLTQHAAEYGFIQRYPDGLTSITGYSPEPWHWRYVGVATATDMKAKGIQTLEQYFGIAGGDYS